MGTRKYLLKSFTVHPGGNIMGRFNCLRLVQVEAIPRHRDSIFLTK